MIHTKNKNIKHGFTIVELLIVIVVIGILASISVVGYGAWRNRTTQNVLKSDLKNVRAAMESAKNFGQGYPLSIPSSFKASGDVAVTYISGDATHFCINASSISNPSIKFYINNTDVTEPTAGSCTSTLIAGPVINYTGLYGDSTQFNWNAFTGAASYEVQWRQNQGSWTVVPVPLNTQYFAQSGRSVGVQYDYQVRAVQTDGTKSDWSTMVSLKPFAGPTYLGYCYDGHPNDTYIVWPGYPSTQYPYYYILSNANGEDAQIENDSTGNDPYYWIVQQDFDPSNVTVQYVNPQGQYSVGTTFEFHPNDCTV